MLTSCRIVALPAIFWALVAPHQRVFVVLIIASLISDILDGFLARLLKCTSELGARLDSYADIGTFVSAVAGLIVFGSDFVRLHLGACLVLLVAYLLPQLLSVLKFRRPTTMHLYSSRVAGYAQGFFFTFFFAGASFAAPFFYFVVALSLLNSVEEIVLLLKFKQPRSNARGLYWVLKE